MIKETIVVEGKNDAAAVRKAVDAEIIITSGFGINGRILTLIRKAQERNGVIVLTDPDFMGEKIRRIVSGKVAGVKHAFVPREEATLEKDIGVENASPESIKRALETARAEVKEKEKVFSVEDIACRGLTGQKDSAELRAKLGAALGIGYANAKQLLHRLNAYGVTRQEFESACEKCIEKTHEQR